MLRLTHTYGDSDIQAPPPTHTHTQRQPHVQTDTYFQVRIQSMEVHVLGLKSSFEGRGLASLLTAELLSGT